MKTTTLFLMLFYVCFGQAQDFDIIDIQPNDTIYVNSSAYTSGAALVVKNYTSNSYLLSADIYHLSPVPGVLDSVGFISNIGTNIEPITYLAPGQVMYVLYNVWPNNNTGTHVIKYCVWNYTENCCDVCRNITVIIQNGFMNTTNEDEEKFTIYPNPANDKINIKSNELAEMNLYDSMGNYLETFIVDGDTTICIDNYSDGIYFVSMLGRKQKFIKQH